MKEDPPLVAKLVLIAGGDQINHPPYLDVTILVHVDVSVR